MYKSAKRGWYKLVNPSKFIPPTDKHMRSFNESTQEVEYKSRLELRAMKYADFNKHVLKFSVEPFPIKYIKPLDGKYHRYYIDMYLEFSDGSKFLVEVKSKGEAKEPDKPKRKTQKSINRYQIALQTYSVNIAKWSAAEEFCKQNGMKFIILTEKELGL